MLSILVFLAMNISDPPCKRVHSLTFLGPAEKVYNLHQVKNLYDAMSQERGCDEGINADGATEIVCKALVSDFKGVVAFGARTNRSRKFLLNHINESADESDLEKISTSEVFCPPMDKVYCLTLIEKAKKALKNMRTP